jgi:hypothetical protein
MPTKSDVAINVSRADTDSNLLVERAVAKQVSDYLLHYTRVRQRGNAVLLALVVQLIAAERVTPAGSGDVVLTREELLAYVKQAQLRLGVIVGEEDA